MKRKGQAAMEFLMTYGWAILVVLLAIGALAYFGVLSPQKLLPERTIFTAPIPNVDNAVLTAADGTIEIAFKNNKGTTIELEPTAFAVTTSGSSVCTTPTIGIDNGGAVAKNVSNGAGFLMKFDCANNATIGDSFKADISFSYKNVETSQIIKQSGSVDGAWK